jgi:hypothetical protein
MRLDRKQEIGSGKINIAPWFKDLMYKLDQPQRFLYVLVDLVADYYIR